MDSHKMYQRIERAIAGKLVRAALAEGRSISVHEGGAYAVRNADNYREVMAALCSTEFDTLRFDMNKGGRGWAVFIWGNGLDVINDWSASAETACVAATDLSDAICEKLAERGWL